MTKPKKELEDLEDIMDINEDSDYPVSEKKTRMKKILK